MANSPMVLLGEIKGPNDRRSLDELSHRSNDFAAPKPLSPLQSASRGSKKGIQGREKYEKMKQLLHDFRIAIRLKSGYRLIIWKGAQICAGTQVDWNALRTLRLVQHDYILTI